MAEFQVTAQQLRTKAGELRDMNSKLKGYIEELVEKEANLATMWRRSPAGIPQCVPAG